MAGRAHIVPVHLAASPIQGIAGPDLALGRLDMKPAPAALRFRPGIIGKGQRLQPPPRK